MAEAFDTPTISSIWETLVWLELYISREQGLEMTFVASSMALYIRQGVILGGVRLGDQRHWAATTYLALEGVAFKIRQEFE